MVSAACCNQRDLSENVNLIRSHAQDKMVYQVLITQPCWLLQPHFLLHPTSLSSLQPLQPVPPPKPEVPCSHLSLDLAT